MAFESDPSLCESDPWPAPTAIRWLVLLLLYTTATPAATLLGYAMLPADTFIAGPTSGQFIEPATLPRSRGFEGMAISPDGGRLFPMLEGALLHDAASGLGIYSFDTHRQKFLNAGATTPSYCYHLDEGATAIGDFTLYSETQGLIIERDSHQGDAAALKKIGSSPDRVGNFHLTTPSG